MPGRTWQPGAAEPPLYTTCQGQHRIRHLGPLTPHLRRWPLRVNVIHPDGIGILIRPTENGSPPSKRGAIHRHYNLLLARYALDGLLGSTLEGALAPADKGGQHVQRKREDDHAGPLRGDLGQSAEIA